MRAAVLPIVLFAACSSSSVVIDGSLSGGDTGARSDAGTNRPDAAPTTDAAAQDADPEDTPDAGEDAGADVDSGLTPDSGQTGVPYVYAGSAAGNIHLFQLNPSDGTLAPLAVTAAGSNPSFLAFSPGRRHLYAVNEAGNGTVAAFSINPSNGELTFLNRVSSEGSGPAHLSVDQAGRFVLVANYGDGAIASLPIQPDGSLGAAVDTDDPGENAHLIITDPANTHLFVPFLGSNFVAQYHFDPANGMFSPNTPPNVPSEAGAGPRHMAFHPNARWAYVINERNSTITHLNYDAQTGLLTPVPPNISTLPVNFGGTNTTSHIVVHPNGRFVYGANRGHDSIAIFGVDQNTGALAAIGHTPAGGMTPRNFTLTPDGNLLLAANLRSDTIHAFRVNPADGSLAPLGEVAQVNRPSYVGVILLP